MKFLYLLLPAVVLSSCMQISSMQTGRTLEKKETEIIAEGALIGFNRDLFSPTITKENGTNNSASLVDIALSARRGFGNNIDAGLRYSTLSNAFKGEVRYQFLGNAKSLFAGSAGLGGSTFLGNQSTYFGQIHVPLYFSFHKFDRLTFFGGPRYMRLIRKDQDQNALSSSIGMMYHLSKNFTLGADLSNTYNLASKGWDGRSPYYQAGIGVIYKFNQNKL